MNFSINPWDLQIPQHYEPEEKEEIPQVQDDQIEENQVKEEHDEKFDWNKNETINATLINFEEEPRVILLIGKPRRGKSNAVKFLLLENTLNKQVFQFGIVFTRTSFNTDYDFLPEKYVYQGYSEETLQRYLKMLEDRVAQGKEVPPNFVIFDDLIGLLNKNDPFLINFFSTHRHTNTSIFMTAQYLVMGANTTLRETCSHALMFNSKTKRTLESFYENFGQLFDKYDEFKEHFLTVSREKFVGCLYFQDTDEILFNYVPFKAPNMSNNELKLEY